MITQNLSGKEPFTVLSNNFSLAHMNNPVWPGCFSCSEDDYVSYLKEKSNMQFSLGRAKQEASFLIRKNLLDWRTLPIQIKKSRIESGAVRII